MLQIETFVFGPFGTNTYVVSGDERRVFLIDPACSNAYEQQQLLRYISSVLSPDGRLTVIATHGHLDHLWGAPWVCEWWKTSVQMHEADIPLAKAMQRQYDLFGVRRVAVPFPMEPLHASDTYPFEILHTPGHTPGSVCLYYPQEKVLFSGDTLFQMGYGRTDLPGGDLHQLIASLTRLMELPEDVKVYSGHGETTTIGEEKR